MLIALDLVVARNIPDHLRIGLDHGQRRAQIMRDVGNQVLAHLIGLGQLLLGEIERLGELVDLGDP